MSRGLVLSFQAWGECLHLLLETAAATALDDQLPPPGVGGGLVVVVGGEAQLRGLGLLLEEVQVKHGHMSIIHEQGAHHNLANLFHFLINLLPP